MGYPLGFGGPFPEKGRTGSLLSAAYNAEESKLSVSNYFPVTYIFKDPSVDQMQPWRSQKLITPVVIIIYTAPAQQKWKCLILT